MRAWKWIGTLSIVLWGTGAMVPATTLANPEGYSLDSIKLESAGDLVQVCTIDPAHEDYAAALAFCYGFFEGAIRYHQALSGTDTHKNLVCPPDGTTRLQGVDVFVRYMQANPQYADEGSIDAIFRALMAQWPCAGPK